MVGRYLMRLGKKREKAKKGLGRGIKWEQRRVIEQGLDEIERNTKRTKQEWIRELFKKKYKRECERIFHQFVNWVEVKGD